MWARGLAAGLLATSALLGLTYALAQLNVVSFFPLDVAQAGVRLTPGAIATQGIEALGTGAKMLAEASALVLVLLVGAVAGGVVTRFGLQRSWSNILPLAAVAFALVGVAAFRGYWEQRGWDPSADVRTQSTIDTGNPALGSADRINSDSGLVVLGGYAFAGIRDISSVELNIDDAGWQPVQLKSPGSDITWRPWRYTWRVTPGEHIVTVRATDGGGVVQSAESLPPHPSGASGWQTLRLRVE